MLYTLYTIYMINVVAQVSCHGLRLVRLSVCAREWQQEVRSPTRRDTVHTTGVYYTHPRKGTETL